MADTRTEQLLNTRSQGPCSPSEKPADPDPAVEGLGKLANEDPWLFDLIGVGMGGEGASPGEVAVAGGVKGIAAFASP